jgi:hypothetical protein
MGQHSRMTEHAGHMAKHIAMNSGKDMSENDNLEEQYVKICLLASFPCTLNMFRKMVNPLNAQFNPICHLPALLGAHHIFHISR